MKRNLTLLAMLLAIVSSAAAQKNQPILVAEGLQWAKCNYAAQYIYTLTYELRGDTVIDGKTYIKEWQTRWEDLSHMELTGGFMREDNGKVYRKDFDEEEYLWFDYNANIGDSIFYEKSFVKVVGHSDTTITCNGVSRIYKGVDVQVGEYDINIGNADSYTHYDYYLHPEYVVTFYEGLGLLDIGDIFQIPSPSMTGISQLLWIKRDGELLYQSEEGVFWHDNTGVRTPIQDNLTTPYYDLMGREVTHPTHGIYIKNGRKVVIGN